MPLRGGVNRSARRRAEPAARWRRQILDESAEHSLCGQHGTIAVERLTRGNLAGVRRHGAGGSGPYKGDRSWSIAWTRKGKVTRRERFLAEMDAVVPWPRLVASRESPRDVRAGYGKSV